MLGLEHDGVEHRQAEALAQEGRAARHQSGGRAHSRRRRRGVEPVPFGGEHRGLDLWPRGAGGGGLLIQGRGLAQDEVRVCAAEPEGAHPGDTRRHTPSPGLCGHLEGDRRVDVGVDRVEVQVRWDEPTLHTQSRLDEPGDARGGLQVAEVGLHRAHDEGVRPAQNRVQGADLDGVTQRRARAVGLDVADLFRAHARAVQRLTNHRLLRGAVGHGEAAGPAIVVDRAAPDDGVDGVAVAQSVGEALEHHDTAALTPGVTVGGGVEGLAAAVGGQGPGAAEINAHLGVEDEVHTGGQGQAALARPEALAGEVRGHQ